MLNNIILMGRLVRDPEVKILRGDVTLTQFTVAVDRDYQKQGEEKQADFIVCHAWRQTGEFIGKYFRKGSMIVLEGSLQSSKWTDEEGKSRISWFVNVSKAHFGESKREAGGGEKPYGTRTRDSYRPPDIGAEDFTDLPDDGELPF